MIKTAALETLGCKVNQYESSYFLESLKAAGYKIVSFRERADLYIVHSCAVTSKAAFQTRQLLRRAQRLNPTARIVVTGCEAQLEPERMAQDGLATHILGNSEKFDLIDWLEAPAALATPCIAVGDVRRCRAFRDLPLAYMHSGRARATLKVQDGCDAFCSYCVVPYTRGASRSLPAEAARAQLDRFIDFGYREVVLTGIHLGLWGKEHTPAQEIADLLAYLENGAMPPRLRLSSLEPMEWSRALLEQLSSSRSICPHFHLPLQSGDAETLKRMHRPYTPDHYADVVQELHIRFPEAALGADVMVGFPGETHAQFERTVDLIRRLPLTYLHVFPYSPRPGTPAARWPERITGTELKRRAKVLQSLSAQKKQAFRRRFLGECVEVLAETPVRPGWWQGTSRNYLQVLFPASGRSIGAGDLLPVRLLEMTDQGLIGA